MKKLILFTCLTFSLGQISCSNPATVNKETSSSRDSTTELTKENITEVQEKNYPLKFDSKTLELEEKITNLLKDELKNENYQKFFSKYENYLIEEGALKNKNGKGYLELLKETLESRDVYSVVLSPNEMKGFEESDKMNLRGFVSAFDKVENEIKELPKNSPLKVYANIIQDIREKGNVDISNIFTKLVESLDEKTLDKDFYQEYTLLFMFAITK